MGSGQFPAAGFAQAAYIRDIRYFLDDYNPMTPLVLNTMPNNPLLGTGYDSNCYGVGNMTTIGTSGTQGFFLGGPGYTGTNSCI